VVRRDGEQVTDVGVGDGFGFGRYNAGTCNITFSYGSPGTCFTGPPVGPAIYQTGLKDTAIVWPGNVTRYGLHFVASSGGPFPFDPTVGPGYVWHCHILDHEDNDMMRPYKLLPA
jgi:FtsP/CotA-like multicopper oxidase with cupredoxin domain